MTDIKTIAAEPAALTNLRIALDAMAFEIESREQKGRMDGETRDHLLVCIDEMKTWVGRLSEPQPLKFPRGPTGDIDSEYLEMVISHLREHGGGPVATIRWTLLALESLTEQECSDPCPRLVGPRNAPRPSIGELECLLNSEDTTPVKILPNGQIMTLMASQSGDPCPQCHQVEHKPGCERGTEP